MSVQDTFQSIAFSGARFTSFTANAILFGIVPICILVLRPAFNKVDAREWSEGKGRLSGRLEDLVQACLVASVTATIVGVVLQAAVLAGREGELGTEVFTSLASTSFGRAYLVRLPLLAGLSVLLLNRVRDMALAGTGDEGQGPRAVWWGAWATLAAGLLATSSFSGHAAVGNPRVLSIGNDIVHLLSGATWFSGIVILAAFLPLAWKKKDAVARHTLMTPAVVRFSNVALIAITIVAITGVVNSLFDVGRLEDLVSAGYGIALSVKILIFLGVLGLGGFNHFFVRRKLERSSDDRRIPRIFRRAIAIELALGLAIMGVTGILTGLEKTRTSAASASAWVGSSETR